MVDNYVERVSFRLGFAWHLSVSIIVPRSVTLCPCEMGDIISRRGGARFLPSAAATKSQLRNPTGTRVGAHHCVRSGAGRGVSVSPVRAGGLLFPQGGVVSVLVRGGAVTQGMPTCNVALSRSSDDSARLLIAESRVPRQPRPLGGQMPIEVSFCCVRALRSH